MRTAAPAPPDRKRPPDFDARLSDLQMDLFRWAVSRLRNSDDAKDLVAELSDKLLRTWWQFEPGTNFEAWVYCAARHLLVDVFRRKGRAKAVTTFSAVDIRKIEGVVDPQQGPEQGAYYSEIITTIKNMRPLQRDILVAIVVNDESYQDVADRFGISLSTVKSRIWRARSELQKRLAL